MQSSEGLTKRSRNYIDGIRGQYVSEAIPETPAVMPIAYVE